MSIELTKNQASALQSDIAEINSLQQILDVKKVAHVRHRDAIARDGGAVPAQDSLYKLEEISGVIHLVVTQSKE